MAPRQQKFSAVILVIDVGGSSSSLTSTSSGNPYTETSSQPSNHSAQPSKTVPLKSDSSDSGLSDDSDSDDALPSSSDRKSPDISSGETFLSSGLQCASRILQRKLFSESADRFGLILAGKDVFGRRPEVERELAVVDWDLVQLVESGISGTQNDADWLDAIAVALNSLRSLDDKKCTSKKVVLISDLGCRVNDDKFNCILDDMKKEMVEFTFIGPKWVHDGENVAVAKNQSTHNVTEPIAGPSNHRPSLKAAKTDLQQENETLIKQIVAATDGIMCDVDTAILHFMYVDKRAKRPTPWRVQLQIGPDIKINTVGYIRVRKEPPNSWKKCLAKLPKPAAAAAAAAVREEQENEDESESVDDPMIGLHQLLEESEDTEEVGNKNTTADDNGDLDGNAADDELKAESIFVRKNEDQAVVEPEKVIMGHMYGSKFVPVSDEEERLHKYKGGLRGMSVIGFTSLSRLQRQHLFGEGCMVFQPLPNDKESTMALSALAFAMHDLQQAAIVRRVYRDGLCPRVGALLPDYNKFDMEGSSEMTLIFVELPFSEDLRNYLFAPVYTERTRPSDQQLAAVDDLIESSMLISKDPMSEDPLRPETIPNPYYQHVFRCMSARALGKEVRFNQMSEDITDLMRPPKELQVKSKEALENIERLFQLKNLKDRKGKVTAEQLFKALKRQVEASEDAEEEVSKKRSDLGELLSSVTEIGTVSPAEDFQKMIEEGLELDSAAEQLEQVVLKLVQASFAAHMLSKIRSCLKAYRQACLDRSLSRRYNDHLQNLNEILSSTKREDVIVELLKEEGLGLIPEEDVDIVEFDGAKAVKNEDSSKEEDSEELLDQL